MWHRCCVLLYVMLCDGRRVEGLWKIYVYVTGKVKAQRYRAYMLGGVVGS